MKLSDVDYQGDRTKATFYYTAEERVDFRELIRKLAEAFRVRIEMRQIGMRQEASRLGGIGSCGGAVLLHLANRFQKCIHRSGPVSEFVIERSEEHTSELQSLMRISYAVFCL